MPTQVASLFGVLNLDDRQFRQGMESAQSGFRGLGSTMRSVGGSISGLGRQMMVATLPIAAGLGYAIHSATEFDSSMMNINAVLGITGDEAAALREELLSFGGATRAGPQEVAEAFYEIVGGVEDASTHMAILDAAVRTSEAGQASLLGTTSALISTMNSYGLAAEDATYLSDLFTRTVGMGVLSMDELAAAFPRITGLANSMGIEVGDMAASMAYLTTQGFEAGRSSTFLQSMMTTLLNPTTALSDAMGEMGYASGQAMVDALGLVGAYDAIRDHSGFEGIITNQEALQGALALTGEGADEFFDTFAKGIDGATAAAREIQNAGVAATWDQVKSSMDEVAIRAGDILAPILMELTDNVIRPLIEALGGWIAENPEAARTIMLIAGAAVVAGLVLSILGTAVSALGVALGILLSPAFLVAAAIAGIVFAAQNFYPGGISQLLKDAGQAARDLAGIFTTVLGAAIKLLTTNVDVLITHFRDMLGLNDEANRAAMQQRREEILAEMVTPTGGARQIIGGQASGGPVMGGTPYIVGERGPELFVPSASGTIVPNDALGGAMDGGITISGGLHVHVPMGMDGVAFANDLEATLRRQARTR